MTTEDQQEYAEAHRGLGSMRGDARKRETATLNSELRVAPTDSVTDSVADSFTPEQRAAIEADVLRRVAEEGPVHFAMTHRQPQFRGMNVVDPAWLRAEADRIEEGAR